MREIRGPIDYLGKLGSFLSEIHRRAKVQNTGFLALAIEALDLLRNHHFNRKNYIDYELYRIDIPRANKLEFIPDDPKTLKSIWETLNPPAYASLFYNKYIFHRFFAAAGLALSPLYGIFDPECGISSDGRPLRNLQDLKGLFEKYHIEQPVIKPVEGTQSKMTYIIKEIVDRKEWLFRDIRDRKLSLRSIYEEIADKEKIRNKLKANPWAYDPVESFMIEERVEQDSDLTEVVGPVLSPVRILTVVDMNQGISIAGARFHLLDHRYAEDANYKDVIDASVDFDTGEIGMGYKTKYSALTTTEIMPTCARPFRGFTCPKWDEVKRMAVLAAKAFPWSRVIGWDIGITPNGPVLIEGNTKWGPATIQIPSRRGLMRGALKETYEHMLNSRPPGEDVRNL